MANNGTTTRPKLSGRTLTAELPSRTSLAEPHTGQSSELLNALLALRDGDFSVRLPRDWTGLGGKIADTFNEIAAANAKMAGELNRVGSVVGKQGKTRQRVKFDRLTGAWGQMETSVNTLIDDLLWPTTEMTRALAAVAQGDLLQTVRLDVDGRPLEGEFLRSATIVNTMIRQLGVFTSEVTRVAREVGTEGRLGGQAVVPGIAGTWKDLTDSVRSFQTPDTPLTWAWPPSLPSVPTSRATRVTSDVNTES
jgi:hypothetical protein